MAAEGLTDKEIAKHLNLSRRTIGTYWERLRLKIGPYSRTQLVAQFLRVESDADPSGTTYRNLFASWEEGVWIISPVGTTLYANHRIATLFGFAPEEFPEADVKTLFQVATNTTIDEILGTVRNGPHMVEFRLQRSDGEAVWLRLRGTPATDSRGRLTAFVLMLRDITVDRRIKRTLASCETAVQFLAETSAAPIARFDRELTCISVNSVFCEIIGVNESEVTKRRIWDLDQYFRPVESWQSGLHRVLNSGETEQLEGVTLGEHRLVGVFFVPEPTRDPLPRVVLAVAKLDNRA